MKKSLLLISSMAVCSLMANANQPLLLPLTSARQMVDDGKYIIAAYNHHWGTENHADMRFLKFEDNKNKYVTAADATAESVIWTAHAATDYTCTSTAHGYSSIVTLSHGNQYLKLHTSGTPTENATTSTNTHSCNIFEFAKVKARTGAAADKTYFEMFYDKGSSRAWFYRNAWVNHEGKMGFATYPNVDIGEEKRQYQDSGAKWTTYFRIWHVIETQDDLAKHAKGYKDGILNDPTTGDGVGQFVVQISDDLDEFIEMENSQTPVTQEDIDRFNAVIGQTVFTLSMPKSGTYLTFSGATPGPISQKTALFYNTAHGTGGTGGTKMNLDKSNPAASYSADKAIMYFEETDERQSLLSYSSGYYLGLDASNGWLEFRSPDDMAENGRGNQPANIGIAPGTNNSATYQINFEFGTRKAGLHIDGSGSQYWFGNRCSHSGTTNLKTTTMNEAVHDWIVAQVTALPVTLADDGYGSFYAPVAVTFPDGVTVHAATVGSDAISFRAVEAGTPIPPHTPVVLCGTPGSVNATILYDYNPDATPSPLTETEGPISFFGKIAVEKLTATEGSYTFRPTAGANNAITLTKVDVGTCLPVNSMLLTLPDNCPLIGTDGTTVSLNLEQPNSTTGLRELNVANTEADTRIYDLQGRRLAAPVPGLNIINGRKVLVK